jgi:hypothetical protein
LQPKISQSTTVVDKLVNKTGLQINRTILHCKGGQLIQNSTGKTKINQTIHIVKPQGPDRWAQTYQMF